MKKIFFQGSGWVELTDDHSIFTSIANENEDMFTYDMDTKILIFTNVVIKVADVSPSFYIGNEDAGAFLLLKMPQIKRMIGINIEEGTQKTLWYNPYNNQKEDSTLCGNSFMGEYLVIANPKDLAHGEVLARRCDNCFYKPTENNKRCNIIVGKGNLRPRTIFRRRKNEDMPSIIDQKEVAQYCKYFTHWDVE